MAIERRRRKDGTYSFRAKVKDPEGNWYSSEARERESDAKQDEVNLEKKKLRGGLSGTGEAKKVTCEEYWEVWSLDRRDDTSDGWKISQNQMWRDHIKPYIGELKMGDVDQPLIGRILSILKNDGYADNTRKHVYSLLNQIFSDAVSYYRMLDESPVNSKFHRPTIIEVERPFWEPEKAWEFLEFIQEMPRPRRTMLDLAPPVWLQIQAALRPGEVQGLRWPNVVFNQTQIRICEIWNNKTNVLQPYPKGKKADYVPMTPALKKFLLGRMSRSTSEYVAPSHNDKMMSYETYLRALQRACRVGGFSVLTPHELRHTCTEIWVQAGASPEDIRRLLNQASLSATKRYIHRTEGRLQTLAQAIVPGSGLRVIAGGVRSYPESSPSGEPQSFRNKDSGAAV